MQQQFSLPDFCPLESYNSEQCALECPEMIGDVTISYTPAREILTKATGFMNDYHFTLNPYSGCSYGCSYCYAAFFSRDIENSTTGATGSPSKKTPSNSSKSANPAPSTTN